MNVLGRWCRCWLLLGFNSIYDVQMPSIRSKTNCQLISHTENHQLPYLAFSHLRQSRKFRECDDNKMRCEIMWNKYMCFFLMVGNELSPGWRIKR